MTAPAAARRYRFGPLDRPAWLLGLGPVPCVLLGAGVLAAALVLRESGSVLAGALPLLLAAVASFARFAGRPAHEWLEPALGWAWLRHQRRDRWSAAVPAVGTAPCPADLPPFLEGLEVLEVPGASAPPRAAGVAVVVDPDSQLLSATVRVQGGPFALLEQRDQAQVLDGWGSALAAFCRERTPVTRVTWSEWAAPAPLDEHLAFVREQQGGTGADWDDYRALVGRAGPLTISHETLVTLSVDRRRLRQAAHDPVGVDALLDELQLFVARLERADLAVGRPLGPGELGYAVRLRTDPSASARLTARRERLAERARVVAPHNLAPVAVDVAWRHVGCDHALHRTYWVAEWPRLEMPADWLSTLLLHPGGIRTVTVVHEPVSPLRSRRAVDREATRLASDEDERSRRGFRIRAQHRRAESEVLAREAELVAGYAELRYAGFLTVTAFDLQALEEQSAEWEQVAAQCGLELRALDGQHDLGLATALPLGRYPRGRGQR